jgi:hypothetical protein
MRVACGRAGWQAAPALSVRGGTFRLCPRRPLTRSGERTAWNNGGSRSGMNCHPRRRYSKAPEIWQWRYKDPFISQPPIDRQFGRGVGDAGLTLF